MVVRVEERGNPIIVARDPAYPARIVLALAGFIWLAGSIGCDQSVYVEDQWSAMGQPFRGQLWMATEGDAAVAFSEMREQMAVVNSTMGYGVEGSLLTDLNRRASDEYVQVDDRDFYRVLSQALDYAQFSHGAYDPTVPPLNRLYARESRRVPTDTEVEIAMAGVGWDKVTRAPEGRAIKFRHPGLELDLSRVALGFSLDVAARVFARAGSRAGLLRLGPVVAAWQSPPDESTWDVPIEDPRDPSRTLLHVRVANRYLAVAGRLETDVSGILDPRTGKPAASDLLAVLTIADSAAGASALSSALYVMGSRASGDLLGRMHRAEAVMLVASDGGPTLLASASLKGRLELSANLKAELSGNVRYLLPPQSIEVELP